MKLDYINEENKFNEDEFEELTEDEIYLNKGADAVSYTHLTLPTKLEV